MKIFYYLGIVLAVVVAVLFLAAWRIDYMLKNGELYERHIVPGKPTVDIQIYGFVDSGFSAYIDGRWRRRKIFDSLECYGPDFIERTNAVGHAFQGSCVTTRQRVPMYQVQWSQDAQRIGIAFNGFFVAGYDRATGQKIEFRDYLKDMHVKNAQGGEIWHDYKQCDRDIDQFLRGDHAPRK